MGFSRQEYWSGLPFPSPGESSQPRDWTQVSHIAGRRFTIWATREASLDTSTTERHAHFGSAASFLLVLLVIFCSSPVAYWTLSDLGDSSFSVISFGPFIQFMRFSWQVYWGGLPFPPGDHILSVLSAMTRASWVALHGMAHSSIELHKPLWDDEAVIHDREITIHTTKLTIHSTEIIEFTHLLCTHLNKTKLH